MHLLNKKVTDSLTLRRRPFAISKSFSKYPNGEKNEFWGQKRFLLIFQRLGFRELVIKMPSGLERENQLNFHSIYLANDECEEEFVLLQLRY